MHLNTQIDALLKAMNRTSLPGIDLSLVRMWELLAALGNPHEHVPPVMHIAGTNGKGSTLAFLRAMLMGTGLRVHAYTSPHLVRFNERIVLAGHEIPDEILLRVLQQVQNTGIEATFFESTTAAAFLAFSQTVADVCLLETGLGGRLDATNVVAKPLVSIITPIDFDHMEFLGETLEAIAGEKAGIMKHAVPCVVGQQLPQVLAVLIEKASAIGCPLLLHGRDWHYQTRANAIDVQCGTDTWQLPLPQLQGAHQHHNAALASVAAKASGLPTQLGAIATAQWPARLQKLTTGPLVAAWNGDVFLDGGHNPHAARAIAAWAEGCKVAMLCGMMRRKDAQAFFAPLAPHVAQLVTIPIAGEDCYAPEALAEAARAAGIQHARSAQSVEAGLKLLQDCQPAPLILCGSLFLAGEILKNHS